MTIDRLRLPLAGGRLGGVVTLTGTPEAGTLGLDLSLSAARAERVLAGLGIPPGLEGELALGARLAASGRSVAELVGTLEGEGELRLHDGTMPSLLPGHGSPPQRVISLDGRVAAMRGVLTSEPALGLTLPAAQGEIRARLDLAAWIAELAVALGPTGPEERAKTVTRRFVGPPGRLRAVASEPEPAGRAELARP